MRHLNATYPPEIRYREDARSICQIIPKPNTTVNKIYRALATADFKVYRISGEDNVIRDHRWTLREAIRMGI